MNKTIVIDKRFCGPPRSGNGGYVCGLIGQHLDGTAEVRLNIPPPLDQPLELTFSHEQAQLKREEELVGSARLTDWDLEMPVAPSLDEAITCERHYVGFKSHSLPHCFVCGPERREGDGLRIFAGPRDNSDIVASSWRPQNLPNQQGEIDEEFVWAALDCPGFFAVRKRSGFALLGAFSVKKRTPIFLNQNYIVMAWPVQSEGRKHIAGTAILDDKGTLVAQAKATWISVPEQSFV